ncbi:MAG: hypothetical protein M1817_006430 [Caeruleum heppii]|nr:MAG: hypothetical protein M1817_006430 [Caeruleum heppii]
MAERILLNEYKTLSKEPWVNIQAKMSFPSNYPYSPPDFKFLRPIFHPNIYPDGKLCISILHAPGDDEMSGEVAAERWSPAQRVESVLISILSLLDDAEVSSPANVDAAVMLRKDPEQFKAKVTKDVEASKQDIPEGFVMPTSIGNDKPKVIKEDPDFWYESGDDDFGGSDSDPDMIYEHDEDDGESEEDDVSKELDV